MKKNIFSLLILFIFIIISGKSFASDWAITEVYECNDTYSKKYCDSASITGKSGSLYIAFDTYNELMLATQSGSSWNVESLLTNEEHAFSPSLLVTSDGFLHVFDKLYNDYSSDFLRYTTNESGSWVSESIAEGDYLYFQTFEDNAGLINVFAVEMDEGPLFQYKESGDSWSTTDLVPSDDDVSYGFAIDVVMDPDGVFHSFYSTGTMWYDEELAYVNDISTWDKQKIEPEDAGLSWGGSKSMAIDDNGVVHLIFEDDGTMYYSYNKSGSFVYDDILFDVEVSQMKMVIDSEGKAHVIYADDEAKALMYATNHTGSWQQEMIDSGFEHEWETYEKDFSVYIDDNDDLHVAYAVQYTTDLTEVAHIQYAFLEVTPNGVEYTIDEGSSSDEDTQDDDNETGASTVDGSNADGSTNEAYQGVQGFGCGCSLYDSSQNSTGIMGMLFFISLLIITLRLRARAF